MTVPPADDGRPEDEGVSLDKPGQQPAEPAFDPYRFGAPERPVPPEYAPPGYVPPPSFAKPAPPVTAPPGLSPPPPPYGYGQYPPPRAGNGKAVAGLVLGIASIVFCWTTIFDAVLVILGLIFGILGLSQSGRRPDRSGRGMAIAGIACSVVGAVLAILLTVWVVHLADDCGGLGTDSSVLQQCVQDHI